MAGHKKKFQGDDFSEELDHLEALLEEVMEELVKTSGLEQGQDARPFFTAVSFGFLSNGAPARQPRGKKVKTVQRDEPMVETQDEGKDFHVVVCAPGLKRKPFSVQPLGPRKLSIEGWYSFGKFFRVLEFAQDIEARSLRVNFNNNIAEIRIPKEK